MLSGIRNIRFLAPLAPLLPMGEQTDQGYKHVHDVSMLEVVMINPTIAQAESAARRKALDFNLTARAVTFARLYAENPRLGATRCAIQAGYARRCRRGAHVRAHELLKDQRVIRAIIFFSARVFNDALAKAREHLTCLAIKEGRIWSGLDRRAFDRLTARLNSLETYAERLERIYIKDVYIREYMREWCAVGVGSIATL